MQTIVRTVEEFQANWNSERNFLFHPDLIRFDLELPPAEEIVDQLRKDPKSRVQVIGDYPEEERSAREDAFRSAPLESVVDSAFTISHFHLSNFYGPGGFLEEFQAKVMVPWRAFLAGSGFTWQRCYPIIFISGKNCSSSYHVDVSHVVAWQVWGTKIFNSFQNPTYYAPVDVCVNSPTTIRRPDGTPPEHNPDDVMTYRMEKGDLLWNQILTPHWVPAGDDIAVSVNISQSGISFGGQFSPHEQVLRERWEEHPEEAWLVDRRY